MKALVKEQRDVSALVVKNIPEPIVHDDEIKIKIHAAGICGTDLHILKNEYPHSIPIVMGHEYSGIVVSVGKSVKDFAPGDMVVSSTAAITCGTCEYCKSGRLIICKDRLSIGSGINGAFAQYLVIPSKIAFKVPVGISLDEAVLCEPLAVATRCVIERSKVSAGQFAAVSGPGPIGLLAFQIAKASGAKVVVLGTDFDKSRMAVAKSLGAIATINVDKEDVYTKTKEITKGKGFDIAYECAGVASSAETCLKILKISGDFVQLALYGKTIKIDQDYATNREINILTSMSHALSSWDIALRLLQFHQVDVNPLISGKFVLEDWEKAFDMAINKKGIKVLLLPNYEK